LIASISGFAVTYAFITIGKFQNLDPKSVKFFLRFTSFSGTVRKNWLDNIVAILVVDLELYVEN